MVDYKNVNVYVDGNIAVIVNEGEVVRIIDGSNGNFISKDEIVKHFGSAINKYLETHRINHK